MPRAAARAQSLAACCAGVALEAPALPRGVATAVARAVVKARGRRAVGAAPAILASAHARRGARSVARAPAGAANWPALTARTFPTRVAHAAIVSARAMTGARRAANRATAASGIFEPDEELLVGHIGRGVGAEECLWQRGC